MSEKEETVEVTIKIPKSLMKLLEDEKFFGFDREYFFEAAVRGMIGCYEGTLDIDELTKFHKKYGREVAVHYVPELHVQVRDATPFESVFAVPNRCV